MNGEGRRSRAAAAALVIFIAAVGAGCWGRAFFRAPTETLAASTKIDSLLEENAVLRERLSLIEEALRRQDERDRGANAQLKIDLEEIKDQLNAVTEMLRDAQQEQPFKPAERRRTARSDTTQARSQTPQAPAVAPGDTALAAASRIPQDSVSGAAGPAVAAGDTAGTVAVPAPPPEELYRQIYLDYSRREYQIALDESDAFLAEYPDDPLVQEILYLRGQSLTEVGRQLDALKEYSTLLQRFPGGRRAPGALLRMAIAYESMGQLELAAGVVRRLIGEYPQSSEAKTAEERFASILQN